MVGMKDNDAGRDAGESREVPAGHAGAKSPAAGREAYGSIEDALTDLAATTREAERVEGRLRAERQRMVEADEATLAEWALSLASRGIPTAVDTVGGRTSRGWVVAVGADFLALGDEQEPRTMISLDAVAALRVARGDCDERRSEPLRPERATLAGVLSRIAGEHRLVTLAVRGVGTVCGELRSVGRDILVVQREGSTAETIVVQLRLIEEVSLFGSG